MKTFLVALVILLASCSDDGDPKPSCKVLKDQLESARQAIIKHQAKGSSGNPGAWEVELRKLVADKDRIYGDYSRQCL